MRCNFSISSASLSASSSVLRRPLWFASFRNVLIASASRSLIPRYGIGTPSQCLPSLRSKKRSSAAPFSSLFGAAAAIMIFAFVADRTGIRFYHNFQPLLTTIAVQRSSWLKRDSKRTAESIIILQPALNRNVHATESCGAGPANKTCSIRVAIIQPLGNVIEQVN